MDPNGLELTGATFLAALAAWALGRAAIYLRERTHNERLFRVADGASHVAGAIRERLSALPPDADVQTIRNAAVASGVASVRAQFAPTIAKLKLPDDRIAGMIGGELGRLNAPVAVLAASPPIAAPPAA